MSQEPVPAGSEVLEAIAAQAGAAAPVVPVEQLQLMTFLVAGVRFAVRVDAIRVVAPAPRVAAVPGTPSWLLGVANHRGEVVPVLDLGRLLALPGARPAASPYVLIVLCDTVPTGIGCTIDALSDIVTVAAHDVQPPIPTLQGPLARLAQGTLQVGPDLVTLLHLGRLGDIGAEA